MFASRASSESRETAGSICANTAECEDFWESRADDAVHDAEAEQAIGLTQHGYRVGAAAGVLRVGHSES